MKMGFRVSDDQEVEEEEVGFADATPNESCWYSELPEYFVDSLMKFWFIYGIFSSIRDLLRIF